MEACATIEVSETEEGEDNESLSAKTSSYHNAHEESRENEYTMSVDSSVIQQEDGASPTKRRIFKRCSDHPDYVPRGGRKTKAQSALLHSHFHLYKGYWEDKKFSHLVKATGFNKKQLNKWFWDR